MKQNPVKQVTPEEAPMIVLPGIGAIQARHITVCSCHFEPRTIQFHHSERRVFTIPAAVSREEPSYLRVYDSVQMVASWPDITGPPSSTPMPVPAETIVADIEANCGWVRTSQEGVWRLGLGRIKGDVGTPEEIAELQKREDLMAGAVVREADKLSQNGKGAEITSFHRACLRFLDLTETRDWAKEISLKHMKVSPISGNKINMNALADGGIDLLEFYSKHNLRPEDFGDDFIAGLMAKNPGLRKKPASAQ